MMSKIDPKGTYVGLPALSTQAHLTQNRGLVFTERKYSTTLKKDYLSQVDLVNTGQLNTSSLYGNKSDPKGPFKPINSLFYKDVKQKNDKLDIFKKKHHSHISSKKLS